MALLFRMATVEVTERYSAGRWAGLEYPIKPSRMLEGDAGRQDLAGTGDQKTDTAAFLAVSGEWNFLYGSSGLHNSTFLRPQEKRQDSL